MDDETLHLRILFFRSRKWWVGQCLEYDIASQAKTLEAAVYEMQRVIAGHLIVSQKENMGGTLEHLPQAPQYYWDKYNRGTTTEEMKKLQLQIEKRAKHPAAALQVSIPKTEMRCAAAA